VGSNGVADRPLAASRIARGIKTAGLAAVGSALITAGALTTIVTASASGQVHTVTISQVLAPSAPAIGSVLSDYVMVSGHAPSSPTKPHAAPPNIDFQLLFNTTGSSCTGTQLFATSVALNLHNRASVVNAFTVSQAGTYSWIAHYTGNSDNAPNTQCDGFTVPTGGVQGCSTTGGCGGNGGVHGGTQGISTPETGSNTPGGFLAGVVLLTAGFPLLVMARRSSKRIS